MSIFVKTLNVIRSIASSVTGNAKTIIDISKWQSSPDNSKLFNFDVYETSDGLMIIVKASQGIYADRRYVYYIGEILKRKIFFGTYHFADMRYTAIASARKWASQINALPADMYAEATRITRHFLDVENYGFSGKTKVQGRTWIREFLAEVERLCPGIKFGIYTSYYGWSGNVAWMPEIAERDLWVAHYYADRPSIPPEWFYSGMTWLLWQTCDSCTECGGCGIRYGAASISIDINEFNGSMEAFNEWKKKNGDEGMSSQEYLELLNLIQENEGDISSNTDRIEALEEGVVLPPEDKYDTAYIITASPTLRIRETPETGEVVATMPYGETCMVDSSISIKDSQNRGYWVPVKYEEHEGYTADWYLAKK